MRPLPILLALALLPGALATWNPSLATQEPSTTFDTPGRMWQDPTSAPWSERVYLDVTYAPTPASGALPRLEATLGAWRDCNQDGYIGLAGSDAYATFLLLDMSSCPPGSRHNDGATVHEVLWIGPGLAYPHIDDPGARVWADEQLPGLPAPPVKTSADDVFTMTMSATGPEWVGSTTHATPPSATTAYAHVTPGVAASLGLTFPGGWTSYVYGAEHCFAPFGISGGWQCDPAQWPSAPLVGDVYQLRDVDCLSSC